MNPFDGILAVVWNVVLIPILVFLSQVFTGLNIGLMSLDTAQLQVLIDVPNKSEAAMRAAQHARRILPLRQKGNLLLCTILLGNTAVNAFMAVSLGNLAGGFVGFLATTAIIVVFCEIVPQSVCTRHGLYLGAMGAPIIRAAMVLFYPITKLYALVLDFFFPQRENMLDRSQLRSLVEYQKAAMPGMLASGQAEMLIGALGFADRTAGEVMVPLEAAFKIRLDSELDYKLGATVVQKGFSRFPVVDAQSGQVKGVLHCKDLLTQRFLDLSADTAAAEAVGAASSSSPLRTADAKPPQQAPRTAQQLLRVLKARGQERQVFVCGASTTLMSLLAEFKRRPHLAVVADTDLAGEVREPAPHIGIVTLHDIFARILQAPVGFTESVDLSPRRERRQAGAVRLFDQRGLGAMAAEASPLGESEAEAVLSFLVSEQPMFSPEFISEEELTRLLRELRPERPARRAVLCGKGGHVSCGTLVLQGAVHVVSGEEQFESTVGPWSCINMRALEPGLEESPSSGRRVISLDGDEDPERGSAGRYVPDFTATVLTDGCLVLRIERRRYMEAHRRSMGGG